jgi:hypothetical protein
MDGTVYMCSAEHRANLNAFQVDPLTIWNSERYKELRYRLDSEEYDETCMSCHILINKLISDFEIGNVKIRALDYRLVGDIVVDAAGHEVLRNNNIMGWVEAVERSSGSLRIVGWAAGANGNQPCKFVIAFVNGVARAAGCPTRPRPDVAEHFERPRLVLSGYDILSPRGEQLAESNATVRVFAFDEAGDAGELEYS